MLAAMKLTPNRVLLVLVLVGASAQAQIDLSLARQYFGQLKQTSDADAGRTWGVPLYGPIFFVDDSTHAVVADRSDPQGQLKPNNGVWTGVLPNNLSPANTAIDWLGMRWTMVLWPVNQYRQPRESLLLHECFHRVQEGLGLPARDGLNSHLDSADGRIWLELEWRALERALREQPSARKQAIADALLFRAYRRTLLAEAAANENRLELNEGLAEYTGVKLSSGDTRELAFRADHTLRDAASGSSFVRSFAYTSGPAYGALLDLSGREWRKQIVSTGDLGKLLGICYGIEETKPTRDLAMIRASRYEAQEIIAEETRRSLDRETRIAAARKKFIESPILILPLSKDVNYSFNPNNLLAIDSLNTVYPTLRLVDSWGTLEVSDGAWLVRSNDGSLARAQVPGPRSGSATPATGDGWTLMLNEGWKIAPAERAGDFQIEKVSSIK